MSDISKLSAMAAELADAKDFIQSCKKECLERKSHIDALELRLEDEMSLQTNFTATSSQIGEALKVSSQRTL
jgi:hypothetical protein